MMPQNQISPGELVFESSDGWKIFRQDAGMGEWDYALFKNEEFYCRAPCREIADTIIGAIRFSANMRNAEKREKEIREDERQVILDIIKNTGDEICGSYGLWEMNSNECYSFNGNCTLCKVTKVITELYGI